MNNLTDLYKYLPNDTINWELIFSGILLPYKDSLKETMQEAKWHKEGDVLTHTMMVCEELIRLEEYKSLTKEYQLVVFLAALFHDIAKPVCTKIVDDEIRSFHHPTKGANITREYFWKKLGLSGKKEYQEFREGIALLVRYHSEPTYFNYEENKNKLVIKLSLNTKLTKYFNNQLLYLLAKSDILGRIADSNDEKLEYCEDFKKLSVKLNCYQCDYKFSDNYTKIKYLNSDTIWHQQELFDPTWGEVIIVCGLPGTGKDEYIRKFLSNYPVISLDEIRRTMKIKPTDEQGEVYNIAKETAKTYLRNKIPFVWNATNITNITRSKQIDLFHEYNAKVKVIFLETSWEENLKRNQRRKYEVNQNVISDMLCKLTIVENHEAEIVEWICI